MRRPSAVLGALSALLAGSLALPAPAQAANVGTIFEFEMFKFFAPTGYADTCQGAGQAEAFKAGSVLSLGVPFPTEAPARLRDLSLGSGQMQGSELTDRGTCIIRYLGSARQGVEEFSFYVKDPFGLNSPNYTTIHTEKYGRGAATVPVSRPDLPSISQSIHLDMFSQA
jgi:hypothetical protein